MQRSGPTLAAVLLVLALSWPAAASGLPTVEAPGSEAGALVEEDHQVGEACLLGIPDAPIGIGACPGVRPGAVARAPQGTCTLNFVVTGRPEQPEDPTRMFIGTAGHCVLADDGERSWAPGTGPAVRDGAGEEIGRVVYARLGPNADYALIEPGRGVSVSPTVCHFGGPEGVAPASSETNVIVQHSGQAMGFGSTVPGRSHLARRFDDTVQVRFDGPVSLGDSGSPLLRSRRAVGIIVSIGTNTDGAGRALRLGPQLSRAGAVLNLKMSLVHAPA
jgi:hypothetical protein